jgi:hypothetical protein
VFPPLTTIARCEGVAVAVGADDPEFWQPDKISNAKAALATRYLLGKNFRRRDAANDEHRLPSQTA